MLVDIGLAEKINLNKTPDNNNETTGVFRVHNSSGNISTRFTQFANQTRKKNTKHQSKRFLTGFLVACCLHCRLYFESTIHVVMSYV